MGNLVSPTTNDWPPNGWLIGWITALALPQSSPSHPIANKGWNVRQDRRFTNNQEQTGICHGHVTQSHPSRRISRDKGPTMNYPIPVLFVN